MSCRTKTITLVVVAYVILGIIHCIVTPLWAPPDEELHFAYTQYIALTGQLPSMKDVAGHERISQAFHPPLYYLTGSFFCIGLKTSVLDTVYVDDHPGFNIIKHPPDEYKTAFRAYLLRCLSLAFGVLLLVSIYRTALHLFPNNCKIAGVAVLLAAANPQFIHVSTSITNEVAAASLVSVCLVLLLRYGEKKMSAVSSLATGAVLGCCLLTKTSTIFLIPVVGFVILTANRKQPCVLVKELLIVFGAAGLIAGWWYLLNWNALSSMQTSQPWFIRSQPLSFEYVKVCIVNTFVSFFGCFGALQFGLDDWQYAFWGCLFACGASGVIRKLINEKHETCFNFKAGVLLMSLIGAVLFFLILNLKYYAFLGKYLYVAVSPIAVGTAAGLFAFVPGSRSRQFFFALLIILCMFNVDVVMRIIRPAYKEPEVNLAAAQEVFYCRTPWLKQCRSIGQTFVAETNNLCAVRIMFSRDHSKNSDEKLRFTLARADAPECIIRRIDFSSSDAMDTARYYFAFPPIKDSAKKKYIFTISSSSQHFENATGLWYADDNLYADGGMVINGRQRPGDLYFAAYSFIGKKPSSQWEGVREIAISQDLYITVREMQLYASRRISAREKSITHKKYLLVEKAFNRQIQPDKRL